MKHMVISGRTRVGETGHAHREEVELGVVINGEIGGVTDHSLAQGSSDRVRKMGMPRT
jgi:hypothetical protein